MDPADQLKQEVCCPICLEYFRDPVMIDCGHHFCRRCITRTWGGLGMGACPQCRAVSQSTPLRPNRLLQTIVGLVRRLHQNREKRAAPGKCPAHEEQLSLYCMEDQRALCVLCTMNFDHLAHCVLPLEVARSDKQLPEFSLFNGSSSPTHEVSCESCLCPVTDPITPACSHSFCRACVARTWSCPTCKPKPKATLLSPAVVTGQLGELYGINNADLVAEELEPHWGIQEPTCSTTCHDEARQTCSHVTCAEAVWNPMLSFSYRTKPAASFQKLKEIVKDERARVVSGHRNLRKLLRDNKSFNLHRIDAMHHSIIAKQRKAILDQQDSLTSIFKSFRLGKIQRCLHGRVDAIYHLADIEPTLDATKNKKCASCRAAKKKTFSADSDLGAEGPTSIEVL